MKKHKPIKEAKSLANALKKSGVLTPEQAKRIQSLLAARMYEEAGLLLEKILDSSEEDKSEKQQRRGKTANKGG